MSYRTEVAADSPTRQYLLDDTSGTAAVDNIGGTSATYNGSPTLAATSLIASGGGTAVAFAAASSQYLVLPIAFAANAALSFEIWFKWTSGTAIVRDNTSSAGTILGFDNGGTFTVRVAGGTLSTSKTTAQVQDGNTHHLVVTRVAGTSRQTEVYLDGVSIASGLTGSGANTTDLRVARNGSIAAFSDLTADEIAFYSSVLSATRVAAHYAAGIAGGGTTETLTAGDATADAASPAAVAGHTAGAATSDAASVAAIAQVGPGDATADGTEVGDGRAELVAAGDAVADGAGLFVAAVLVYGDAVADGIVPVAVAALEAGEATADGAAPVGVVPVTGVGMVEGAGGVLAGMEGSGGLTGLIEHVGAVTSAIE